ncbi:hypothetical protein COHA_003567 [Chlorella ohadii]|uniref:Uncharacterized protein n=1 Tax=Chlorella ohadii TaxID=2649997 RepID=A0AAD5DV47_9CHLO|nr:hypothetical protein COHA_003567 [Chlorella ohadii]
MSRVDLIPVRYRAADGTVVGVPVWIAAYGRRKDQCAAYLEADCGRRVASLGAPGGQQWVFERAGVMTQTEHGLRHNTTLFRIYAKGSDELCGTTAYLGARGPCGSQPQLGLFDLPASDADTVFQLLRVPPLPA